MGSIQELVTWCWWRSGFGYEYTHANHIIRYLFDLDICLITYARLRTLIYFSSYISKYVQQLLKLCRLRSIGVCVSEFERVATPGPSAVCSTFWGDECCWHSCLPAAVAYMYVQLQKCKYVLTCSHLYIFT